MINTPLELLKKIPQQFSSDVFRLKKVRILLGIGVFFIVFLLIPLPDPLFTPSYSTVLLSSNGNLLGSSVAADGQWRFPLSDSVPEKFSVCLTNFEDQYFRYHPGINLLAVLRATKQNIGAGKIVSGASTISMQVIRLSRKGKSRTFSEKILEMILALKLEYKYSKDEIMALYASHAPFGGNVVGLEAASRRYFGREAKKLSWAESATLAVLPNSPSIIYPGKNQRQLREKRDRLLKKLWNRGVLDSLGCALACKEPLPGKPKSLPSIAPHLLQRAKNEGLEGTFVNSSIKIALQKRINALVAQHHERMSGNEVHNAGALVIELKTGKTLAYVGNAPVKGKDSAHGEYVDIITSKRSTGSLLKPFLYALSVDEGLIAPKTLLPDIPMFFRGFAPKNFDRNFDGAVPADQSLSRSLNVPFVYLLKKYSYEKFHLRLKELGMTTLNQPANHYGLSLVLGGAETTLWDITAMYAGMGRTLNGFFKNPEPTRYRSGDFRPNSYLKAVSDKKNSALHNGKISAGAIWRTFKAMKELRRPDEEGRWEIFESSQPVAWKTGTSFGFRDAWAVGLTPEYVVGVWLGNADGEGRPGLTGLRAAAPLLFDIFDALPRAKGWFPQPMSDMPSAEMCQKSGMKAGPDCPENVIVRNPVATRRSPACAYHKLVHLDENELHQVNSRCYEVGKMKHRPWFVLPPVQAWYYKKKHRNYSSPPPLRPDCRDLEAEKNRLAFIYPRRKARIYVPVELDGTPGQTVFESVHRDKSATIFWHLDGDFIGRTEGKHVMSFRPSRGVHTVTITDKEGNSLSKSFEIISD
ncbi:penicillin-binding protein 1C (plasmid) [Fulvitalea axinellae]|uniref:peptidoglycan glycosyltransferase n=1 Tax=Fulvitalea axinellae TaxID=1182444 RepID=A0AAU9D1P4_9BACT|nr:penicillin-binding protein 1C [Fulvitalea axinellae]